MSNKNKIFLRQHPLTVRIPSKKVGEFRKLLLKANESFPIGFTCGNDGDGVIFYIRCDTIYFAEAYFHLGVLCGKAWLT